MLHDQNSFWVIHSQIQLFSSHLVQRNHLSFFVFFPCYRFPFFLVLYIYCSSFWSTYWVWEQNWEGKFTMAHIFIFLSWSLFMPLKWIAEILYAEQCHALWCGLEPFPLIVMMFWFSFLVPIKIWILCNDNFLICFLFLIQNFRLSKCHLDSRSIWPLLILYFSSCF